MDEDEGIRTDIFGFQQEIERTRFFSHHIHKLLLHKETGLAEVQLRFKFRKKQCDKFREKRMQQLFKRFVMRDDFLPIVPALRFLTDLLD